MTVSPINDLSKAPAPPPITPSEDLRLLIDNPIFERKPGQPARPANPHQWVHWVEHETFTWPPDIAATNKLLSNWGLPPLTRLPGVAMKGANRRR